MTSTVSRLEQFRQQIARENVNLAVTTALKEMKGLAKKLPAKVATIATVATRHLAAELDSTVDILPLLRDDWRSQLSSNRLALVLVESDYGIPNEWRSDLLADSQDNELVRLAQFCEQHRIPCALWITFEANQLPLLRHLFSHFSHILVGIRSAYNLILQEVGSSKVHFIPPCIDILHYNPARPANEAEYLPAPGSMAVTSDCLTGLMYEDRDSKLTAALQQILEYQVWLYESENLVRPRESYMPQHFLRRSLGTLSASAVANLLKISEISVLLETSTGFSAWRHNRRILQAMASKSLPLSPSFDSWILQKGLRSIAEQFLGYRVDDGSLPNKLDVLLTRRTLRERLQHLFFREAVSRHSVRARLLEIGQTLGAHPLVSDNNPKVSVILPTIRPENFPFALTQYRKQHYDNKELIVVVNSDDASLGHFRRQLSEMDKAKVIGIPSRWSIGVCLNVGIAQATGDFWAKFDDDDIYGPNYLGDYVLSSYFVDFDIAGKANVFTYDERADRTILRRAKEAPHSAASSVAGGTLFAKNVPEIATFPEHAKGLVDIWFQWQLIEQGRQLYSTDPYNFMQIRRSDRRTHTWRIEVADMGDAETISAGLALEAMLV